MLYLDYDGVLHPDEVYVTRSQGIALRAKDHVLFEGAPRLIEMLAPYPELRIVLSTTWVRILGFERAKGYLPVSLAGRVIGATFHRRLMDRYAFQEFSRGEQILSDVNRRQAGGWLALDDDDERWSGAYRDHLVRCSSESGLLYDERAQRGLCENLSRLECAIPRLMKQKG